MYENKSFEIEALGPRYNIIAQNYIFIVYYTYIFLFI